MRWRERNWRHTLYYHELLKHYIVVLVGLPHHHKQRYLLGLCLHCRWQNKALLKISSRDVTNPNETDTIHSREYFRLLKLLLQNTYIVLEIYKSVCFLLNKIEFLPCLFFFLYTFFTFHICFAIFLSSIILFKLDLRKWYGSAEAFT